MNKFLLFLLFNVNISTTESEFLIKNNKPKSTVSCCKCICCIPKTICKCIWYIFAPIIVILSIIYAIYYFIIEGKSI